MDSLRTKSTKKFFRRGSMMNFNIIFKVVGRNNFMCEIGDLETLTNIAWAAGLGANWWLGN